MYEYPAALNGDYGEPLGLCHETAPGSGVFTREWSKTNVTLDCNTWSANISNTPRPTPPPTPPPPPPPPPVYPCSDYGGDSSVPGYSCHGGTCVAGSSASQGNCGVSLAEPKLDLSHGCSFKGHTKAGLSACAAAAAAACDAHPGCGSFALDPRWSAPGARGVPTVKLFRGGGSSLTPNNDWNVWVKAK